MIHEATEPPPPRGVLLTTRGGAGRIVADNPGPMTYHGTNTYLVDDDASGLLTIIDPGPDLAPHIDAVAAACTGRACRILLTHTHADHAGAAPALRARVQAPIWGWHRPWAGPPPDHALADGEETGSFRALHSPGHAPDHLVFEWRGGIVFTGDHVMGWSTTVVSPPDGDMTAYMESLRRLTGRGHACYLPAHGPAIASPESYTQGLLKHRLLRERQVLEALSATATTLPALTRLLYPSLAAPLLPAAERSTLAHLLKLERDDRARQDGGGWCAV
jgi:glyoxylase-like metal-dependent hydrolase (beta-lactamase superfamily II)